MRDRPHAGRRAGSWGPRALSSFVVLGVATVVVAVPVHAQDYSPPRNEWAQPDLQGIWQVLDTAPHYNIEPHNASYGVPAGTGIVVDPPNGMIPYNANGLAKREANRANRAQLDPIGRCYKPGTPHIMYLPFPLQILQSENLVTINSEYVHNTRFIYLHRSDHYGEGDLDLWNGDSVGRYEGDALVTDVYNFHPDVWLDRSGNHAGGWTLQVQERLELIDADTLRYRATLEDPEDFTRPWTIEVLLYRHKDPNKRILEYECHAYADNALGPPELPVVP